MRVLVVDDHEAVRHSVRLLLRDSEKYVVCGEAVDGKDGVNKARELKPDVVIMDISMPRLNGFEATRQVRNALPGCGILMLSQHDSPEFVRQALEAGARGYVVKSSIATDLLRGLDKISRHGSFPDVAGSKKTRLPSNAHPHHDSRPGSSKAETPLETAVRERFGVLPNFFRLTPSNPEITANLWGFAQFAYLDNPLPSLFKERLFVYVSRFCKVRYCIARHVGFLIGLGCPAGDPKCGAQSVEEVVRLLQHRLPRGEELTRCFSSCADRKKPLHEFGPPESELEHAIFSFASHVFLQTGDSAACLEALRSLLGSKQFQYLMLFLAFVRTAHYWTEIHPELAFEDDIRAVLEAQQSLAECVLNDQDACPTAITQQILGELPLLRQEAQQATSMLAATVDSSEDAIISTDLNDIITGWNAGAESLFGYTPQEALGKHVKLIVPPDHLNEETAILARVEKGQRIGRFETVRQHKNGALVEVAITTSPIRDGAGKVTGASKFARDLTTARRIEKALAAGIRQHKALFRLADELHRAGSLEDVYHAALTAILEALQCPRASILLRDEAGVTRFRSWRALSDEYRAAMDGHSVWKPDEPDPQPVCISDIGSADIPEALRATLKREGVAALAFIPLVSNGKLIGRFMTYFDAPHQFLDGEIELSLTISRQLSFAIDRKRKQEALQESEERFRTLSETLDAEVARQTQQVRNLTYDLLRAQDEERRHIARELHDSAGQTLTVLGVNLGQLGEEVRPASPPVAKQVERVKELVQQLHREIRTMSYLLHPPLLEETGLGPALNWYIQGLTERSSLAIKFDMAKNFGRLPSAMELAIFRFVQECLTNVHRHSGSTTANIRLSVEGDIVQIEVRDQGKGIPAKRLAKILAGGSGVGIRGMQERLRQFGGTINIDSNGLGTRVLARVPLLKSAPSPDIVPLESAAPSVVSQAYGTGSAPWREGRGDKG